MQFGLSVFNPQTIYPKRSNTNYSPPSFKNSTQEVFFGAKKPLKFPKMSKVSMPRFSFFKNWESPFKSSRHSSETPTLKTEIKPQITSTSPSPKSRQGSLDIPQGHDAISWAAHKASGWTHAGWEAHQASIKEQQLRQITPARELLGYPPSSPKPTPKQSMEKITLQQPTSVAKSSTPPSGHDSMSWANHQANGWTTEAWEANQTRIKEQQQREITPMTELYGYPKPKS